MNAVVAKARPPIPSEPLSPVPTEAVPHAASVVNALAMHDVDADVGLSAAQVAQRRGRFGLNQLSEAPPAKLWRKLLGQFQDLVIWILIVAAILSGALGEWVDAIAILAIVVLNGVIGFFQEERAERLAALQKLSAPTARVIRDGLVASSRPASWCQATSLK